MKEDIKRGLSEAYRMLFPYRTEDPINESSDPEEYNPEDDPDFIARKEKEENQEIPQSVLDAEEEKYLFKKHGVDEKIKTPFEEELEDYELHLASDAVGYDEDKIETGWTYFISTAHDPSVGIYASNVSPFFNTVNELQDWWIKNKEQLMALWDKEDWAGMDKLAGNKLEEKFDLPKENDDKKIENALEDMFYDLGEDAYEGITSTQLEELITKLMQKFQILDHKAAQYAVETYLYKNKVIVKEYLQREPVPPGPKSPKPGNSLINEDSSDLYYDYILDGMTKEEAFKAFLNDINLTHDDITDGKTKEDVAIEILRFDPRKQLGESKMKFTNKEVMALMETSPEDIELYKKVSEKTGLSVAHLRRMAARKEGKHVGTGSLADRHTSPNAARGQKERDAMRLKDKNEDAVGPTTRGIKQDFKAGGIGKLREEKGKYRCLDCANVFIPITKTPSCTECGSTTVTKVKSESDKLLGYPVEEDNSPALGNNIGKIPLKRNIPSGELRPSNIAEKKE